MKIFILLCAVTVFLSCSNSTESSGGKALVSDADANPMQNTTGHNLTDEQSADHKLVAEIDEQMEGHKEPVEVSKTATNQQKNAIGNDKVNTSEITDTEVEIEMSAEESLETKPTTVPLKPSHDKWDALLKQNVSSTGKVNYNGMKSNVKELDAYVSYLQSFATRDSWTKNEKLAYWINLYNAATVRLIVQNYPVASITDLSGGKPWDQPIVKVGNKNYTLNNIENDIIRPRFKDARIHFAVNCAAKSCPPLMNSAFTAESLNRQLQKQTSTFINGPENTLSADKIEVSKIFDWYSKDFEDGDIITFINIYSKTPVNDNATISYKEYNWALNK